MARIEILAPVGSEEMLRAAVFSGADAVYLGFSGFNARTGAGNFDADSLQEAVRFCHARGVAVHVALNTTVYGTELPALEQAIRAVAASGADAVICQDLAVATLIGKIAPQLPRHGSTQMSVHTLQGALELKELGFTRVVLARELSLPEVEHITKHCGIETECFIHGALCMSVSGQCYMSAFLGGRSGNRGSCAGPCRLPFEANALPEGKPGRLHHLSLKDNSAIDTLDKLQALGVASAKIEGRLRTPEYVAAAVSACLAGREGRAYDRDLLKNAFSRSGFTSGYLDGKIDGTMFGVRSEADAELTKKTLPMLRELYRRERSRVPVQMKLEIEEGGEKLTVTDADKLVNRDSQFWLDSGINVQATANGIKVDSPPMAAILSGAIAFRSPPSEQLPPAAASDQTFTLYNDRAEIDNLPGERALYYVAFFKNSIRGLTAGSPVEYKGVHVGSVADAPYFARNDSLKMFQNGWIPVRIRLEPRMMEINAEQQSKEIWQDQLQNALGRGLSATLSSNNLVLGSKMIELTDAAPGQERLKPFNDYDGNVVIASQGGGLDELQAQLGRLLDKFNRLPLEKTVGELNGSLKELKGTLASANKLLAKPQTQQIPAELNKTLSELRQTLSGVSPQSPVYQDVQSTLKSLDKTLNDVRPLVNTLKEKPNSLIFNQNSKDPIPKGSR